MKHSFWQPVIGLEIHLQLNTESKLFSSAPNRFGDEPNMNISTVCTGQPGALPILNKEAVKKAVLFGLAVKADISLCSTFDRKSYFYPDSPRNFQITQFENPIIQNGSITTNINGKPRTFTIREAHLEDDTGMLKHFSTFAGIDYNRAGAPLIEIVSTPCIYSPKEAIAYATAIRSIALYLGISDGNMDEGSMRIDANISVRLKDETTLRPRAEIKNVNSFTFLEQALLSEMERQISLYTNHPNAPFHELIPPSTYRFDQAQKKTVLMRKKETSEDYRYFPEPDLGPIILSKSWIEELKSNLPELPEERFHRYTTSLGLTEYAATTLINDKELSDYFEEALPHCPYASSLCNWITIEFIGRLKNTNQTLRSIQLPPSHVAKLVTFIENKTITGPIAKAIGDEMIASPHLDPESIIAQNPNYQPLSSESDLGPIIDEVLKENRQSIIDFKAGKERAFGHLVGQVMKKTKGSASPDVVNALLRKKLTT